MRHAEAVFCIQPCRDFVWPSDVLGKWEKKLKVIRLCFFGNLDFKNVGTLTNAFVCMDVERKTESLQEIAHWLWNGFIKSSCMCSVCQQIVSLTCKEHRLIYRFLTSQIQTIE